MKKSTAPRLEAFSGLPKEAIDGNRRYLPRAHRHTPKMIETFRHSLAVQRDSCYIELCQLTTGKRIVRSKLSKNIGNEPLSGGYKKRMNFSTMQQHLASLVQNVLEKYRCHNSREAFPGQVSHTSNPDKYSLSYIFTAIVSMPPVPPALSRNIISHISFQYVRIRSRQKTRNLDSTIHGLLLKTWITRTSLYTFPWLVNSLMKQSSLGASSSSTVTKACPEVRPLLLLIVRVDPSGICS